MDQNVGELLRQGLIMTGIGMGLVFAALALLWGVMRLLAVALRDQPQAVAEPVQMAPAAPSSGEAQAADVLTAERARVAAVVAGALLANALPLLLEPPAGPAFEHGRTAPSWVTANRARVMAAWTPPHAVASHQATRHAAPPHRDLYLHQER